MNQLNRRAHLNSQSTLLQTAPLDNTKAHRTLAAQHDTLVHEIMITKGVLQRVRPAKQNPERQQAQSIKMLIVAFLKLLVHSSRSHRNNSK
ncbi:hypothetical protein OUZ56_000353 [Daphnia magna]|uniref:Uncharacterized protein n=1 Tax=Daphnia magna TaxID=35525 RepID=A0ABQ9ZZF6_9CRUS|nr:hypothetical protein OUZ56_000353 [Daphnia magna]